MPAVDGYPHPAHTHQPGRYCLCMILPSPTSNRLNLPQHTHTQERAGLEHSPDEWIVPPLPMSTSSCFEETQGVFTPPAHY